MGGMLVCWEKGKSFGGQIHCFVDPSLHNECLESGGEFLFVDNEAKKGTKMKLKKQIFKTKLSNLQGFYFVFDFSLKNCQLN